MKIDRYKELETIILGPAGFPDVRGDRTFRWELLKAIWELTRSIKGELNED